MGLRQSRVLFAALLITTFAIHVLGSNEPAPRQYVTPTLGVIKKVSKAGNNIVCEWTSTQLTVVAGEGQGNPGAAVERIAARFDSSPVHFYDLKGRKVSEESLAGHLKPGDVVVVSEDGQMPEPRYLRVFKDDVLVLVRASFDAPLTPVPQYDGRGEAK